MSSATALVIAAIANTIRRPDLGVQHFARPAGSFVVGVTTGEEAVAFLSSAVTPEEFNSCPTEGCPGSKRPWQVTCDTCHAVGLKMGYGALQLEGDREALKAWEAHQAEALGDWTEVTAEARDIGAAWGQCRYFRAQVPANHEAFEGVRLAKELTDAERAGVKLVDGGSHGFYFQGPVRYTKTEVVHLIVGNADTPGAAPGPVTGVVFTWYPGALARPSALTADAVLEDETLVKSNLVR